MNINYDILFNECLNEIEKEGRHPSLLLHVCCAPCSTTCLERLVDVFNVTAFFYNPNIYPIEEYQKRLDTFKNLLAIFKDKKVNIPLIEGDCNRDDFFNAIKINENPKLKDEKERGIRCQRCYEFRLKKAFDYAKKNSFDYFATTLTLSPYKDAEKVNLIGLSLNDNAGNFGLKNDNNNFVKCNITKYLPSDFKKHNGYLYSKELSKMYNLYMQKYCGCEFSLKNI